MSILESNVLIWLGIIFCVSQSAIFSGMNLAMFSLSRLRLEIEAAAGDPQAGKVLAMRGDAHGLLTTILWGNVGVNVLLTLLSDSVLTGAAAFVFSTLIITVFGEIAPQAYFSRNALKVAGFLSPVLRFYQFLLFPVAKPCALMLDLWLGREGIQYFREHNLRELIRKHVDAGEAADIDRLEGLGALNFLSLDDLAIVSEGEPVDPASIVRLPDGPAGPVFPTFAPARDDAFVRTIAASGKKWVILTDAANEPVWVLDTDEFLRHILTRGEAVDPRVFCHEPVIVRSPSARLGPSLSQLRFTEPGDPNDLVAHDVILLWAEQKRVITGTDILGRLMHGISGLPKAGRN